MSIMLTVFGVLVASVWFSLSMVLAKAPTYTAAAQQLWAQSQALAERHAMHGDILTEPLRNLYGPALSWVTSGFGYLWLFVAIDGHAVAGVLSGAAHANRGR